MYRVNVLLHVNVNVPEIRVSTQQALSRKGRWPGSRAAPGVSASTGSGTFTFTSTFTG